LIPHLTILTNALYSGDTLRWVTTSMGPEDEALVDSIAYCTPPSPTVRCTPPTSSETKAPVAESSLMSRLASEYANNTLHFGHSNMPCRVGALQLGHTMPVPFQFVPGSANGNAEMRSGNVLGSSAVARRVANAWRSA
jgi:hypothetical protein